MLKLYTTYPTFVAQNITPANALWEACFQYNC